jgi:hypothetical protein
MTAQDEHGVPLGDFVYNWLLLKVNNELLAMKDMLNAQGFEMMHKHQPVNADELFEELDEFLKGEND